MSAESQINAALLADPDLTEVVDSRIYPDFLAQEIEPPAIVYQRAGTEYITTIHDGVVHGSRVTIEIWCLDTTRIGAEELGDLVEGALANASLAAPRMIVIPIDRRPEYEPESERFVTIVACSLWPD